MSIALIKKTGSAYSFAGHFETSLTKILRHAAWYGHSQYACLLSDSVTSRVKKIPKKIRDELGVH